MSWRHLHLQQAIVAIAAKCMRMASWPQLRPAGISQELILGVPLTYHDSAETCFTWQGLAAAAVWHILDQM